MPLEPITEVQPPPISITRKSGSALAFLFLRDTLVVFVPSIVWLVIGVRYHYDPCNNADSPPNLATFLIVTGSIGISLFGFEVLCYTLIMCKCCMGLASALFMIWGIESVLVIPFDLAWAILGQVRISDDEICKQTNQTLYSTALAADILLYVWVIIQSNSMSTRKKNNDSNRDCLV